MPLRSQNVTAGSALLAKVIISPYFFKIEAVHNVTFFVAFFVPEIEDVDLNVLWFTTGEATTI